MSLESLQQNYSDATGFVIDRTVNPPKILGQAFLVSKSRAVTCASSIFNYTEAPWALGLHFVHPDVLDGVKSITLHNDFDKVAARKWYLAQTGNPGDQLILPNDMASLSLDFQMPDLQQDRVAELHRALSLPFSSEGVEASGNIRGSEFDQILVSLLQSGRTGLLTLLDSKNIPIARLQVAPGIIQKVYYRGLLGELAFFELIYRKPAEGYMFEPVSTFNWGNVRDITAPADALIEEANRRISELPQMLTYLGGAESRYQKRVENVDASTLSENIQWLFERLWPSIDGYMTLDKMSERVGADTYTVLQAMRELVNKGSASMINRVSPFHASQVVGAPLVSHTDFEINAWDPLQSFFLDPLSGKPTWMQGNFFGVANALQPKNMLHTIALPQNVPGALILKDYKLIGVHSGPHTPKPGQPIPPVKLYQMMWMGALLDMSSKKARMISDEEGAGDQSGSVGSLRSKLEQANEEGPVVAQDKLEKFVCPNCYSTNTQVGPCFNCGTVIEPPPPEPEPEGKLASNKAVQEVMKLQKKYNVTKPQLALVAAVVIGFPLLGMAFCGGGGSAPPAVAPDATKAGDPSATHKSSEAAVAIATKYAGFKGTAIPGYWYEDTSEMTKPLKSFGLQSEQSNQKVLFIVEDDMAPVQSLENFVSKPPFTDVQGGDKVENIKVDENNQLLGDGYLHWFLGKYTMANPNYDAGEPANQNMLVGAYPSPLKGQSILVIGRALKPAVAYDYKTTLWLCDQMASDYTAKGNSERSGEKKMIEIEKKKEEAVEEKPIASDDDISKWVASMPEKIQEKLKMPDDLQELLAKKKPPKIKCTVTVSIAEDGSVKKLEITEPGDYDSAASTLTKAINSCAPFEDVPHTKEGQVSVIVRLAQDKVKVERP